VAAPLPTPTRPLSVLLRSTRRSPPMATAALPSPDADPPVPNVYYLTWAEIRRRQITSAPAAADLLPTGAAPHHRNAAERDDGSRASGGAR
ncbi:unnamed protein product, partial [Urochloa humidicola]